MTRNIVLGEINDLECYAFKPKARNKLSEFVAGPDMTGPSATVLPGGHSEWEPPDPFSNSEVKTLCADASVDFVDVKVGHCQALNPMKNDPHLRKRVRVFSLSILKAGMAGLDRFRIGDIEVAALVDADCFAIDRQRIFPGSDSASLHGHDWLAPDHLDLARDHIKLSMHSFLLRTASLNILVDTCIGEHKERPAHPGWHRRRNSTLMRDLHAAGLTTDDIDLVFCTHLHADHVGWNTRLENGRWVPTFGRARYALSSDELAHWSTAQSWTDTPVNHGAYQDSVLPIVDAGQAMLVAAGDELAQGLTLEPLPGHTPASLGLMVRRSSGGSGAALFCGDAIHSPVQLVAPDWWSAFCSDPEQAVATRRAMLSRAAEEGTLLCPAHFRVTRAVRIEAIGDGFRPLPS